MSDKELKQQELQEKFQEFAVEYPNSGISFLLGNLVGLLEFSIESQGGDANKEIMSDGGDKRDITVHAKKGGE